MPFHYMLPAHFSNIYCKHTLQTNLIELPVRGKYTLQMYVEIHSLSSLFVHGAQQTVSEKSCMSARGGVDKTFISFQGIANPKPDDPKIPVEVV